MYKKILMVLTFLIAFIPVCAFADVTFVSPVDGDLKELYGLDSSRSYVESYRNNYLDMMNRKNIICVKMNDEIKTLNNSNGESYDYVNKKYMLIFTDNDVNVNYWDKKNYGEDRIDAAAFEFENTADSKTYILQYTYDDGVEQKYLSEGKEYDEKEYPKLSINSFSTVTSNFWSTIKLNDTVISSLHVVKGECSMTIEGDNKVYINSDNDDDGEVVESSEDIYGFNWDDEVGIKIAYPQQNSNVIGYTLKGSGNYNKYFDCVVCAKIAITDLDNPEWVQNATSSFVSGISNIAPVKSSNERVIKKKLKISLDGVEKENGDGFDISDFEWVSTEGPVWNVRIKCTLPLTIKKDNITLTASIEDKITEGLSVDTIIFNTLSSNKTDDYGYYINPSEVSDDRKETLTNGQYLDGEYGNINNTYYNYTYNYYGDDGHNNDKNDIQNGNTVTGIKGIDTILNFLTQIINTILDFFASLLEIFANIISVSSGMASCFNALFSFLPDPLPTLIEMAIAVFIFVAVLKFLRG